MAHAHFTHNGKRQTRYEFETTDSRAKALAAAVKHLHTYPRDAVDVLVVVALDEGAGPKPDFAEVAVPFSEISAESFRYNSERLAEEGLQHELEYQTIMNSVRDQKVLPILALS